MFEKEAEDYSIDTYETCLYDNLPYVNDSRAREESFKDGAEFGYNKANEWHRVSDKLPKMDVLVYFWKKGKDFPVVARRHLPYGKKEWVWDCMWGSGFTISQLKGKDCLWKEIVLPELPKEIKEK